MRVSTTVCLVGAIVVVGCAAHHATSEIVVRDREFHVTRTISETSGISTFNEHWQAKRKVSEPPQLDWQYKLDIRAGAEIELWLYDPRGYARLVAAKKTPTWQLPDPKAFNAMLGLSNNRVQPTPKAAADAKEVRLSRW